MHGAAAEQVHMDVPDRLAGTFSTIEHRAEAAGDDAFVLGDLVGQQGHLADELGLGWAQIREPLYMTAGDYQDVGGGLGVNVPKGHELLVLVDLC